MKKISDSDVKIIIALWSSGKNTKQISVLFQEQENTIKYYLKKSGIDIVDPYPVLGRGYKDYLEEDEERRIRQKQGACTHPSWRCSCCAVFKDNQKTEEYITIKKQKERIEYLEKLLRQLGITFIQ